MTDTQSPSTGYGKTGAAIISAFVASFIMTQLSLSGVNFEVMGVSSEIVKSLIIGHLVGFFTWLTPTSFVMAVRGGILFVRSAFKSWHDAATDGKE